MTTLAANKFNEELANPNATAESLGTLGGALAGGTYGAEVGTAFGPAGTLIGGAAGALIGGLAGKFGGEFLDNTVHPEVKAEKEKQKEERSEWQETKKARDREQYELDTQERKARIALLGQDLTLAKSGVNDLNKSYIPRSIYKKEIDYDPDFYVKQDEAKLLAQKQEQEFKAKKARKKAKKASMSAQEKEYYDKVKALKLKGMEQELKAKEDDLKEKTSHLKLKNLKEQEKKDVILQRTKDVGKKKKKSKDKAYYKAEYAKKEDM